MRRLKENLFVQFSVISFVVMAVIAALSTVIRSHAIEDLVDEVTATASGRLLQVTTSAGR